ncbi:competence protein CoiA family protein, partial [Pseudothermotoga sp.]|uniref:competence protein CoiA family protein n=1 Tax=Pseudothermotoga sp. TaxID=2033661 RepID=UPI000E982D05
MDIKLKLPYALRNNKLVHINDIPLEQRGEKCGCYCPNCKEPVLARLGNVREHHFAHKGCFCDPDAAFETILHILSKDIIARASTFYLPRRDVGILRSELIDRDYIISDNFESWSSHHSIDSAEEFSEYVTGKVVKGGYKRVKSVTVEKSLDGIIPDIILNLDGVDVAVEIAVTHFVNFEKLAKVRSLKLPLLEIDLSNFHKYKDVEKNRVELEEILIDYSGAKKWVYFPRDEYEIDRCIRRCFEIYDDNRRKQDEFIKIEAERVRKEEERKILEAKRNENSVRAAALKMIPDNYNEILEKHANCISDHVHWKSFIKKGLVKPDDWPSIIDIPIRGEIIFGCDRKIWQGAIYFYLIKDKKSVSPGFVLKGLMKWYD